MNPAAHSDMEFAMFLSTRSVRRVNQERFIAPPKVLRTRIYDNETEQQRLLIRNRADMKVSK